MHACMHRVAIPFSQTNSRVFNGIFKQFSRVFQGLLALPPPTQYEITTPPPRTRKWESCNGTNKRILTIQQLRKQLNFYTC